MFCFLPGKSFWSSLAWAAAEVDCFPRAVSSVGFFHVPEYRRRWSNEHAADFLAPDADRLVLAKWNIDYLVVIARLDLGCNLLLLIHGSCPHESVAQLLHVGILGP